MNSIITIDTAYTQPNIASIKNIWIAVFNNAYDDLFLKSYGFGGADPMAKSRVQQSAFRWFFDEQVAGFNSFENICLLLNLDPARVRSIIKKQLLDKHIKIDSSMRLYHG